MPPRDLAGMYVSDQDVATLLRTLPGLDGPDRTELAEVRARLDPVVAGAAQRLAAWVGSSDDAAARVARRLGLSLRDVAVLAVVLAVELHPSRQRTVAYLQDSVALPRVTPPLLDRLLAGVPGVSEAGRAVLSLAPRNPLRRSGVLRMDDSGPWAARMLAVPERLVWFVLEDGARAGGGAGDRAGGALPPGWSITEPLHTAGGAPSDPGTPSDQGVSAGPDLTGASVGPGLLLVHGGDPESRRRAVREHWRASAVLVTPVPESDAEWAGVVLEAVLRGSVVLLETPAALPAAGAARIDDVPEVRFAVSSPGELPLETLPRRARVELPPVEGAAAEADWLQRFAAPVPGGLTLNREQLRLVAEAADGDVANVPAAVRRLAGGHLDSLAVRIRPRRTWADLILPADATDQVRELARRYRYRSTVHGEWGFPPFPSTGVVAMFAGPSGTGKTLTAEVVAGDLGLDLYKIDLSAVVSKYIGETEKNLERIFEAAGAGDLVLFFDEADALFGKRSEVSDAHDRYANIETAYLLQRLETYDGLVILATNLSRNLDQAFLRRITVSVEFVPPEEDQRRQLWEHSMPAGAPVGDLDLDFLSARFKVTGGVIRNVSLAAAYLAAEEGGAITMERVMFAMAREYQKLGKLRTEADFGPYLPLVTRGKAPGSAAAGREAVRS